MVPYSAMVKHHQEKRIQVTLCIYICVQGYSVCTRNTKHTIYVSVIGPERRHEAQDSGIVSRAASFFFQAIENSPDIESAELRVSFLEIFRGKMRDLNPAGQSYTELKIRQKINGDVYVENLNETAITSLAQVLKYIIKANRLRTMASTAMNKTSSRSHLIVTFNLKLRKTSEAGGQKLTSKVNFIDLAGSEKVQKTDVDGGLRSKYMNEELSILSRVIESLVKRRNTIPFNDSILTWIMKDSLKGNTRTTLVITCSPHIMNRTETIDTCRFAIRCRYIKTKVSSNKELTPPQMKALIKKLKVENGKLLESIELTGGYNIDTITHDEKDALIQQYLFKIQNMQQSIEDEMRLKGDLEQQLLEKNESESKLDIYRSKIEDQNFEIDDLRTALEKANVEKRNLAVMNGLLALRMNYDDNKENDMQLIIADIAHGSNIEYIASDEQSFINELKDLRFNNEESQMIFDSVFKDMSELNLTINDMMDELNEMKEIDGERLEIIENKNFEISKLKNELQSSNRRVDDDDDDVKEDDDGMDIDEQEEYLQSLAEKEQDSWDQKEESAWRKYLNRRAQEEGFRKAKDLLKHRRRQAKDDLNDGKIEVIPQDEELLGDIRDDFYRLFNHVNGRMREEEEYKREEKEEILLDIHELENILDESLIDDPFEWSEDEVCNWLITLGLKKKYGKIFKKEVIDGRVLLIDMNKTNLRRDLMVKSIHIEKIVRSIHDLRDRSDGYDEWKISQGMDEEKVILNRVQIDDEYDVDFDEDIDNDGDNGHWQLTEEEKQLGEQFWALDELFNILDIYKIGSLDFAAFKHGLHALEVELTDDEMSDVFRQIDQQNTGYITYKGFVKYLQFTDFLPSQSQKYASDIMSAIPRVAANRRQYATRAAMVIKYATQYNNTKTEINNYLLNKGLTRAEIDAAWKQFRFNPKAIRDIDFKSMIGKKGKLVDMTIQDPMHVQSFNDYALYKLLKRAGFKSTLSKEFNDLMYLRASGDKCRIYSIRCLFDINSRFFNGLQVTYECANGERIKGGRNYCKTGQPIDDIFIFQKNEILLSITVFFAHFVCGVQFETNVRNAVLFGSDEGRSSIILSAPIGTCIMAFYGSIGRLVETLGVYIMVSDEHGHGSGRGKQYISGETVIKSSKSKRSKLNAHKVRDNTNGRTAGGSDDDDEGMYSQSSKKIPSWKIKNKGSGKFEESSTNYDDDY